MLVGRQRGEARIVDVAADGEVIERLEPEVAKAEHLVHWIVEEAADAGRAHAGRFSLEIERLADGARFPVQPAIEPRAFGD